MLYVTSSRTASPEDVVLARESGKGALRANDAFQYAADDVRFADAARKISEGGSVLYAIRLADGLIKIGWTSNLYGRWRQLASTDGADRVLGFTFGSRDDETELHHQLTGHAAHGREYYHPHPDVLAVINGWRVALGREPVAA